MKKQYTAPEILFEDFTMSASIAAGCELSIDTQSAYVCAVKFGKKMLFVEGVNACNTYEVPIGSEYDGFCYHNPSDSNNLFNS